MDREQLRRWLNCLVADEFAETLGRVSMLDGPSAFAMAAGLKRVEQTDVLLAFYAQNPRETLALLDLGTLRAMKGLRDRPLPLKVRELGEEELAALDALRRLGLAHRGRGGWLLSDIALELCAPTREEEREAEAQERLTGLIRGTLLLTGMLPTATLQHLVGLPDGKYGESRLNRAVMLRRGIARFAMTPRGVWLVSDFAFEPADLFRQVTRYELSATPRAAFTPQQALQAHATTLPVLIPDALPLLRAVGENGGDANITGRELLFAAQNLPAPRMPAYVASHHPELAGSPLLKALPDLLQTLPLWRNLGHCEREIGRLLIAGRRLN